MRMRWLLLLLVSTSAGLARPEHAALLRQVADSWLNERGHWAFTQVVREYDNAVLKQERRERYDPSQRWENRWQLISIDNRAPTVDERETWMHRKNKKPRKNKPSAADSLDFDNAKVLDETAQTVRYELPLRSGIEWLFPINKIELVVTINKTGPALEQVQARISEPFRVALGLARILDIDLDLQMAPPPAADPADAKPSGTARAVVTKLGDRVEYFWSEFKRVPDGPDSSADPRSPKS
jgi:hypothetical protein